MGDQCESEITKYAPQTKTCARLSWNELIPSLAALDLGPGIEEVTILGRRVPSRSTRDVGVARDRLCAAFERGSFQGDLAIGRSILSGDGRGVYAEKV